jgi:AbiV family abortive infection protein
MVRFQIPKLGASRLKLLDVLEKNARRLLQDARILRESESYGSAISLAILSIEECGKFWMLMFYFSLSDRDLAKIFIEELRSHYFKQLNAALMIEGLAFRQAAKELIKESGVSMSLDRFVLTHAAIRDNPQEHPDLIAAFEYLESQIESRAEKWYGDSELHGLADRLQSGSINLDKQNGIYVDFDPESEEILNDPSNKTKDRAEYYIKLAEILCHCFLRDEEP